MTRKRPLRKETSGTAKPKLSKPHSSKQGKNGHAKPDVKEEKVNPLLSGEVSLIEKLALRFAHPHPKLLKGIGDDTSVTLNTPSTVLLTTTDTLVESTHFTLKNSTPEQLGSKALNVSVSDIAAMGGRPTFFLISLILPTYIDTAFVTSLYRGIDSAARKSGVTLAGGNMAAGTELAVTVTLFGEAAQNRVVYRSGAKNGDDLYVTGTPGDSALGLKILGSRGTKGRTREERIEEYRTVVRQHLTPAPRLKAGMRLADEGIANSMIDISDGLALDATRLAKESGVGITIDTTALPLSTCMKRYMSNGKKSEKSGLVMALSGGEDYELLFTADKKDRLRIKKISSDLRLKITGIGSVCSSKPGLTIFDKQGKEMKLKSSGYTHF